MLTNILQLGKNIGKRLLNPPRRAPGVWFAEKKPGNIPAESFWSLVYPLKLNQKFGEVVFMRFLRQYLITGPESFEYILKTNGHNFPKSQNFYKKRMIPMFGASLLTTDGNYWKHRRKIAQPVYQKLCYRQYAGIFNEQCQHLINLWKNQPPKKINMLTEMNQLTLQIVLKIFSHQTVSQELLVTLGKSIYFCNWYAAHAFFITPWKPTINNFRFFWHLKKMDTILLNIIEERRRHPQPVSDLLNLLIEAKNEETDLPFSNSEILAEFKTHLLTGHETTACGLAWMWYLLAQNPQCRQKMEEELKTVLNGRDPTFEDFPNLIYTKAIVLETFRLYPPIWAIARQSVADDQILGYDIPKNSFFLMHIYALHRNPHYWENPEEFRPERFLPGAPEIHPFAYLPFSTGPRICIANQFAVVESVLLTANLAQHFHFDLPKKAKAVIPEPCISLRPKGGIRMEVRLNS